MAKLLGIDIGTSGVKLVLIDEHGRVIRSAHSGYTTSNPRPLWSEQDPAQWLSAIEVCLEAIGEWPPDAIGLTGQMHGAVFVDGKGKPLRPAILWNDQRTSEECAEIERALSPDRVKQITCNPPLTGFQAPKILWVRTHEPEVYARTAHVLLSKDFVRLALCGELATDVTDASGTGLFDVARRQWSDEMISALELKMEFFPTAFESVEVCGRTSRGRVPTVAGAGDQAAAAIGTGTFKDGSVSISMGTSGVVFMAQEQPSIQPTGACQSFCHANGRWHMMGVTLSFGGSMRWFRDTLFPGEDFQRIEANARGSSVGSNGVVFAPYLNGERCPCCEPFALGALGGLRASSSIDDLCRAVFEGTAFSLREARGALGETEPTVAPFRVSGGGAKSRLWLQTVSDVLGAPLELLECDEGPAFGAAILAGIGTGIWGSLQEACAQTVRIRETIEPSGADYEAAFQRYRSWSQNVRDWSRTEAGV